MSYPDDLSNANSRQYSAVPQRWQHLIIGFVATVWVAFSHAASCYSVSAPSLVFSPYHPTAAEPEDIETTVEFYCAPAFRAGKLRVNVTLQEGSQRPQHQIRNAYGDVLRYGVFVDPARSIPLTSNMPIPVHDANPDNKTFRVILYGRIYANQRTAGVGNYLGYLTLLLNY